MLHPPAVGFFRGSLGLTAMSGAAAVLSAVYVTVAGRLLGPTEFGSLATLLALVNLVSLALAPLETGVAKLTAEYHGENALGRTSGLLRLAIGRGGLWFVAAALLSLPLLPSAARLLNLHSARELYVFVAYVGAWLLMSILRGALRGEHRFGSLGLTLALESGVRLALGWLAIRAGTGAAGGMAGYLAGMALSAMLALFCLRDLRQHAPLPVDGRRLLSLSGNLFFVFLYFQVLVSVDMVVAKRTLSASESGFYAACSTIARLILVAAGPVLNVLFTRLSSLHAAGKPVSAIVTQAMGAAFGALLLGCTLPWLAGDLLLRLLFGADFVGDLTALRLLWVTASILVVQQLAIFSLVAINRARAAWSLTLPCVLLAVLLWRFHDDGIQVAACGLAAALSGLLPLALMAWSSARSRDNAR